MHSRTQKYNPILQSCRLACLQRGVQHARKYASAVPRLALSLCHCPTNLHLPTISINALKMRKILNVFQGEKQHTAVDGFHRILATDLQSIKKTITTSYFFPLDGYARCMYVCTSCLHSQLFLRPLWSLPHKRQNTVRLLILS